MGKPQVVVNGGGLVGALLALYLQTRHGFDVTVYEKRFDLRTATAETGRSINLILTSRGLFALDVVGLKDKAIGISVPVEGRMMHDKAGKQVFQPYGLGKHEVNYSVSRTKLNAMLIQSAEDAGVKFFFEHELTGMNLGITPPSATYTDLKTKAHVCVTATAFFGTDGAGSPTRDAIVAYRHATDAPDADEHVERLGISYKEVTFPTKAGDASSYAMAKEALHIWPRGPHFLMGLADLSPTFTGTLYLPDGSANLNIPTESPVPTFDDLDTKEKIKAFIERDYPDVPALVPDYLDQLHSRQHSFLATLRVTHWNAQGKALVLGDAAHAVVPFFGQGMNLGMECVVVLDRCLLHSKANIEHAFDAFVSFQKNNATAIADMAIENFREMSFDVSRPEFLERKALENSIESRMPKEIRSRYYMVTKTLIPYAVVKGAGPCVAAVVEEVREELNKMGRPLTDCAPLTTAQLMASIDRHFTPFVRRYGVKIAEPLYQYYPYLGSHI